MFSRYIGNYRMTGRLKHSKCSQKTVFTIPFEIDPNRNKTCEPLYTNTDELILKGEFVTNAENENNIRLQRPLQFIGPHSKTVCIRENRSLNYTMITPESKYFDYLFVRVEKPDKGIIELVMPSFLFMGFVWKFEEINVYYGIFVIKSK